MTIKKKEPDATVAISAATEPSDSVVPPKPAKKEKPKIVGLHFTPGGRMFVATETTIYEKKGEELVPVKWQVPE